MPRHEYLYGQTLPQLEALCNRLEMPRFAAKQIARWLYDKHATTIEAMSDLSARHRALLAETYEVGLTAPEKVSISTDGTKKYLYRTSQNHFIESAYIPDGDRATLCISSQAGCRMGCRFCATGRQGLQHSLSTNEILNQIGSLPERERLTNVVFMGMGEPLDNLDNLLPALEVLTSAWGFGWSPTRITVSTAGVARSRIRASARGCSLPTRTISGGDPGAFGREPAQPLSARTGRNHARREGMADPRSRGNPAPIRFHAPAAGIVRIHRHERPERLSASHPRAMPPAGRHQVPDQPDPFP